jgi:ATP-dependent Lon protease
MPENVVKVAGKELRRLKKMSPQLPEYPMLRHYLELVADLPWDKSSTEHIDIRKAKQVSKINSTFKKRSKEFCCCLICDKLVDPRAGLTIRQSKQST